MTRTELLKVGEEAPDFELASARGENVRLSDFRGRKTVVLYFYPKDETPGCTIEACTFRDHYEEFTNAGAEVVGVSNDSVDSHMGFAEHRSLPFALLSDPQGVVRQEYGIRPLLGFIPGRVTFVIDRAGKVRFVFDSALLVHKHVAEALRLVKTLETETTDPRVS